MKKEQSIRIAAVSGSVRPGNFTSKALTLVLDQLRQHQDVASEAARALPLVTIPLPSPMVRTQSRKGKS
ncbi:hypothetical protein MYX75_04835 [Acidobacteria bacterium AH-259-A15]|nr:hypothetical protein [Acidobacteria bacterium AH-259-A15]